MSINVPLPAGTTVGKSFEYGVDVNLDTYDDPEWQSIRRLSDYKQTPSPQTSTAQTYDDLGAPNEDVTGWGHGLAFKTLVNRNQSTGLYLPEIEALFACTRPSSVGELAVIDVRWYHKPAKGTPNPHDAGRGFATVAYDRQNVGPDGALEQIAWALSGKGTAEEIVNPFTGWNATVPVVNGVTPAAAAAGELVTITGFGFLGATAVTFGGTAAADFAVVNVSTIVASLPAGAAGAAAVIVTGPEGSSAPFAYTRA